MPVKVTGAVTVFVAMMNLRPLPNRSLPEKETEKEITLTLQQY